MNPKSCKYAETIGATTFQGLLLMELLQCLLPSVHLLHLDGYGLLLDEHRLILNLTSTQTQAACPICGQPSHRVHSRYERTLADLPYVAFRLTLIVQVCKFFCSNPSCRRRIFTERLPEVAAPWARKTARFIQHLQSTGLALGGAAGARLSGRLGIAVCGSTLLNYLTKLKLPEFGIPKALGVDDFAFRKGHCYGTVLVDLETHRPIALLPDRKAETLAEWLTTHPGVEVLSRDRSKIYKNAMDTAAPTAMQVADRFHLVKNLSEYLEQALAPYRAELKLAQQAYEQDVISAQPEATVIVVAQPTASVPEQRTILENQQRRIQLQQTMRMLREKLWTHTAIAQEVGVSTRTVERYLAAPDFPAVPPHFRTFGRGLLESYKQQLLDWWNAGIKEPATLRELLKQQGYDGSLRTVQRYVRSLRQAQGLPVRVHTTPSPPKVSDLQTPILTPKRAAYLTILRSEEQCSEKRELLERVVQQCPSLTQLFELAESFLQLLRKRQAHKFDDWLLKALASPIKPLQTFTKGLLDDYAAVKASMDTDGSNGVVEGLNNKLKMLKRQMFGRAGLDLLSKRFIAV